MAGANHPKFSQSNNNNKPSSSQRKSRWESAPNPPNPSPQTLPNPSPKGLPEPNPSSSLGPPAYGFHMLDRRTIVLADRSVRTYFALPPDYQDFPAPPRFAAMSPNHGRRLQRMYPEDEDKDDFGRQRQQLLQYGNPNQNATTSPYHRRYALDSTEFRPSKMMRTTGPNNAPLKHLQVDQNLLKKAFLHFVKLLNESAAQRKSYMEDGKQGPLKCIACGRSSKDFPDMHGLIMHTYNSDNADLRVDHLGLHKALCALMGWNYSQPPDNSKAYKFFPAAEAATNQDDLIMWPPMVIIHNTNTGKGRDGRMEGLGNKAMDNKIRDLGFGSGKSKSLYGRDGHLGITLVKFNADQSGLKDATRLAEYFERDNHGRKSWSRVESSMTTGRGDDKNPNLVKVDERTGERTRILYGYLGTAADLDKVDFDTRKKAVIESMREHRSFR